MELLSMFKYDLEQEINMNYPITFLSYSLRILKIKTIHRMYYEG